MYAFFGLLLVGVMVYAGVIEIPHSVVQEPENPPATGIALQLPVQFTVKDALTGTAVNGTLYIYDNDTLLEAVSIVDGKGTSADAYDSGTVLTLFFVGTNYVAPPQSWTVPYARVESQEIYYCSVKAYAMAGEADVTLAALDKLGNQFATEDTYSNVTKEDNKFEGYVKITVAAGKALMSYFDKVEDENDDVLLVFELGDTLATLSSNDLQLQRIEYGGKAYYIAKLQDIIATKDDPAIKQVGFTIFYGGTNPLPVTIKLVTATDYNAFLSSLTVDSDGFEDAIATFYVQ